MVKKLWKKWCKKVDEHNEKQGYITQEECWGYYDIYLPFLFSTIITAILCIFCLIIIYNNFYSYWYFPID